MTDWLYTFGRDGCSYFGLKWCFAGWWQDGLWPVVWILLGIGLLLKQAGLAPSTSEANRLIEGGGVRVDSSGVSDKGLKLAAGTYVVQVGKRKFARVTLA